MESTSAYIDRTLEHISSSYGYSKKNNSIKRQIYRPIRVNCQKNIACNVVYAIGSNIKKQRTYAFSMNEPVNLCVRKNIHSTKL